MDLSVEDVWIMADQSRHDLGSLWRDRPLALLPVAGRTVLEYTLDDLFEAGVRRARLAVSSRLNDLRNVVAGGDRWSLEISQVLTRGDADPGRLIAAHAGEEEGSVSLLIKADQIRTPCLKLFLEVAARTGPRAIGESP